MGIQEILSALSDKERRKILDILKKGKISSGDLAKEMEMTPQALSYHLKKLKKADLIYETKYKNFIYYELNLTILDEVILWIENLRKDDENENQKQKTSYCIQYFNIHTIFCQCNCYAVSARNSTCTLRHKRLGRPLRK